MKRIKKMPMILKTETTRSVVASAFVRASERAGMLAVDNES